MSIEALLTFSLGSVIIFNMRRIQEEKHPPISHHSLPYSNFNDYGLDFTQHIHSIFIVYLLHHHYYLHMLI